MPSDPDARMSYRAANRRMTEAEILRKAAQTTGAVYLAGYGVECKLKAVILGSLATEARTAMLTSFRGPRGYDLGWLRYSYLNG